MFRSGILILAVLVLTSAGVAQITTTGPFTGTYSEGYESVLTYPWPSCVPGGIFSGHGTACTPSGPMCVVTYGWLLYCAIYPHNASDGLFGSAQGPVEYTFNEPAQRFGGYFGTNGYLAGGVAHFYDSANNLLATLPIVAPTCAWAWNGWDAGTGPKIKRVMVYANDPYNGGGLLQMDDMELDTVLASAVSTGTGCTGSNGQALTFTTIGLPHFGNASFALRLSHGIPGSSGFFFVANAIASPTQVTPTCSLLLDVTSALAFISAGQSPLGPYPVSSGGNVNVVVPVPNAPALGGLTVAVQGFAYDTGAPGGFVLSNAITLVVGL
jgi:hypothetical protein